MTVAQQGDCEVETIELPEDLFASPNGNFRSNGIRPYDNGLLIANSILGAVYFFNTMTKVIEGEVIAAGQAPSADGLCFGEDNQDVLYIVENMMNRVSAWDLTSTPPTKLGYLISYEYDTATTCDVWNNKLWVVNARFNSIGLFTEGEGSPSFAQEFTMVGMGIDQLVEDPNTPSAPSSSPSAGNVPTAHPASAAANDSVAANVAFAAFLIASFFVA